MRILWITNILFPEAKEKISERSRSVGGGWMIGAATALIEQANIQLYIATVSAQVKELTRINGEKMVYYILPKGKGNTKKNPEYEYYWNIVQKEVTPDIVHIHGTEFSHGLAYINICGNENVVISIQGLTSAIYPYLYYGLNWWQLLRNITLRDIIMGNSYTVYKGLKRRGEYEKEMISKVHHVIGRTSWDRARIWAINPDAKYHFCNETLRPEFYDDKWEYEKCDKHSIFLSGGTAELKGFHMLLKAMPYILRYYPDTVVRVAGGDVTRCSANWKERIKLTNYGKIIKKMIKKYGLKDKISFTGSLSAAQMKSEFLKSNVFVLPSSIENSPNSLGEAQLLGVPCISSYVGGTMDFILNKDCGELYRFEEVEMLAFKICQTFETSHLFDNAEMRKVAAKRHDSKHNAEVLSQIYQHMLND